jgi:hypothetical protein
VIDVQMRAHHVIDVTQGKTCGRQPAHIGIVGLHVPFRAQRPRLIVADATVDQNGVMRRLHDVGLETQDQHVGFVDRACPPHPRPVLGQQLRRQPRQHLQRWQERGFLLDDTMDDEIADGEFDA